MVSVEEELESVGGFMGEVWSGFADEGGYTAATDVSGRTASENAIATVGGVAGDVELVLGAEICFLEENNIWVGVSDAGGEFGLVSPIGADVTLQDAGGG